MRLFYGTRYNRDIDTFIEALVLGKVLLRHQAWDPQRKWIFNNVVSKVKRIFNYKNLDFELQSLGLINLPKLNTSKGTNNVLISDKNKELRKLIYFEDYKLFNSLKIE